jgi:hypothetical protein
MNTNKTKLLIQNRRADKQIHSLALMEETVGNVKDICGEIKVQIPARRMKSKEELVKQIECIFYCYPS